MLPSRLGRWQRGDSLSSDLVPYLRFPWVRAARSAIDRARTGGLLTHKESSNISDTADHADGFGIEAVERGSAMSVLATAARTLPLSEPRAHARSCDRENGDRRRMAGLTAERAFVAQLDPKPVRSWSCPCGAP